MTKSTMRLISAALLCCAAQAAAGQSPFAMETSPLATRRAAWAPRARAERLARRHAPAPAIVPVAPLYAREAGLSDVERTSNDEADIVRFAAGAIEFAVPNGWVVSEQYVGREVRLLVTPEPGDRRGGSMLPRIWVTYHVEPDRAPRTRLKTWLARRSREAAGPEAVLLPPETIIVAGHGALRQPYRSLPQASRDVAVEGFHLLVSADWGIVEIHTRFGRDAAEQRAAADRLLKSLVLGTPEAAAQPARRADGDAQPIVGVWKSLRGRLHLTHDGQIVLQYDAQRIRQLDDRRELLRRPPRRLTGRYHAHGDLLQVTWSDGSRLNLRWRLHRGDLLLTDHLGRISQLKRLLE